MSDQLTQCPHCQTSFRVTPGQLAAAGGMVRCGSCLGLFSAAINFIRVKQDNPEPPPEDDSDLLFADPRPPQGVDAEEYTLYEEYEDSPDLFASLPETDQADAGTTSGDASAAADAPQDADDTDSDEDWNEDELIAAGPSEEFVPPAILFDDDDEDYADDIPPLVVAAAPDDSIALEEPEQQVVAPDPDEPFDEYRLDADLTDDDLIDDDLADDDLPEAYAANVDDDDEDDDAFDTAEYDAGPPERRNERREPSFGDMDEAAEILDEYLGSHDDTPTSPAAAPPAGKPAWLQQPHTAPRGKADLHHYLATLEDDEDLDPLDPGHLDELVEEPVLLAAGGRKRGWLATSAYLLLSLLLIAGLLLQFVDQHLEALRQRSAFARFEPLACAILDCPPPPVAAAPSASANLYSQELLVRSHPRLPGALELSFIFRNDGTEPAAFPGLELSFKDEQQRLLANRLLLPQEYLPAELRSLEAMPGNSSVQVNLELLDPGAEAVNYSIAFRDL